MIPHLSFAMRDPSQVGEARRAALRLASSIGSSEVESGRVGLVVTELGTNLVRHAERGQLLLARREFEGRPSIEVLSFDHGPGMAEVGHCLRDGVSTGGTPGTGMGAVRRLADEFSIFSLPGKGTVILARIGGGDGDRPLADSRAAGVQSGFALGGICLPAPGETVSGDGWSFRGDARKARLMLADGLGHGPAAGEAADAASRVFGSGIEGSPSQMLERIHLALRGTRGAAVAVAELDAQAGTIVFVGAGNVTGRLISGVGDRSLISQHGTAGLQIRTPQEVRYDWPEHAILVLHSDGIVSRWSLAEAPGLLQCDPAVIAGWIIRDHCRGRDDATVVAVRRR